MAATHVLQTTLALTLQSKLYQQGLQTNVYQQSAAHNVG